MLNETKKGEGPSCACGKEDLYEVWLKSNGKKADHDADSANSDLTEESKDTSDSADKKD